MQWTYQGRYRSCEEKRPPENPVATEAEARAFIEAQHVQPVAVPSAWLQIALELKSTGRHIGDLALSVDGERQAELGYSLDRAFQGYGYATEAVAALLNFGFTHLKLHRIVARTDVRNRDSIRLLERISFRREGHLFENFYDKGSGPASTSMRC